MNTRIIKIEGIGPINFRPSVRAKYVNIRIKPGPDVTVSVPRGVSHEQAREFVHEKMDWIKRKLQKLESLEKQAQVFDEHTSYSTRRHRLVIEKMDVEAIRVRLSKGIIRVSCPLNINVEDRSVQDAIRGGIARALRLEAKEYIPRRVAQLAKTNGFTYNKIFFKNARTRWGSCSGRNNLNFNIHLMRLPQKLIDYVILHELIHTIVKNHSKKFWEELNKYVGDAKALQKELRAYRTQVL